jgi:hypothetical protein
MVVGMTGRKKGGRKEEWRDWGCRFFWVECECEDEEGDF